MTGHGTERERWELSVYQSDLRQKRVIAARLNAGKITATEAEAQRELLRAVRAAILERGAVVGYGINLGKWTHLHGVAPFAAKGDAFAGISGGRTSGLMHCLDDERITPVFCNTGREHPRTLDFLHELDCATGNRLVWLEFRKPLAKGAPPKDFGFAIVNYRIADRSGGPLEMCLEALAEYRALLGKEPSAPWPRGRLCTVHSKHRVKDHFAASLGIDDYVSFVGMRADEEHRALSLRSQATSRKTFATPLYDAGITKADVLEFWDSQSFNLDIDENEGNCTACFLKDQSDLARLLQNPETDAAWWIAMEQKYNRFGGEDFAGYAAMMKEGPQRLKVEAAFRAGDPMPFNDVAQTGMDDRRYRLVVLQEKRRVRGETKSFSCNCEASMVGSDDEDRQTGFGW